MGKYVQGEDTDTWHWCKNCSVYPKKIVKQRDDRPSYDLCNQCKSKEKEGKCET